MCMNLHVLIIHTTLPTLITNIIIGINVYLYIHITVYLVNNIYKYMCYIYTYIYINMHACIRSHI